MGCSSYKSLAPPRLASAYARRGDCRDSVNRLVSFSLRKKLAQPSCGSRGLLQLNYELASC